jgi:hypothetical protein
MMTKRDIGRNAEYWTQQPTGTKEEDEGSVLRMAVVMRWRWWEEEDQRLGQSGNFDRVGERDQART